MLWTTSLLWCTHYITRVIGSWTFSISIDGDGSDGVDGLDRVPASATGLRVRDDRGPPAS
jgi:hypothetical protein